MLFNLFVYFGHEMFGLRLRCILQKANAREWCRMMVVGKIKWLTCFNMSIWITIQFDWQRILLRIAFFLYFFSSLSFFLSLVLLVLYTKVHVFLLKLCCSLWSLCSTRIMCIHNTHTEHPMHKKSSETESVQSVLMVSFHAINGQSRINIAILIRAH